MSDLLSFHFQNSTRHPQTSVFSMNKQSVYTSVYWPCITLLLHVFSKDSPHVACNPSLCHCFHLFRSLLPNLPRCFTCQFTFDWLPSCHNGFLIFCFQIFANIDCLCLCVSLQFATGLFLPPSFLFTHSLSMSAFWRCILYTVSSASVPVSAFYSS